MRRLVLPHYLVTVSANNFCTPVLNFGRCAQLLPEGISLGTISPLDANNPVALAIDAPQSPPGSPAAGPTPDDTFENMIAPNPDPSKSQDLRLS